MHEPALAAAAYVPAAQGVQAAAPAAAKVPGEQAAQLVPTGIAPAAHAARAARGASASASSSSGGSSRAGGRRGARGAAEGRGIAGSPDTVAKFLAKQLEDSASNYFVGQFVFGDMSVEETILSVELFKEQVCPQLDAVDAKLPVH